MTADNRYFDVNGETQDELELCLSLVLLLEERNRFHAFRVDPDHGMVLYADVSKKGTAFMMPQGPIATAASIFEWLKSVNYEPFEKPGTHDGDNEKGWRAHMGFWGGVKGDSDATIAIKPSWLWLGK